MSPGWLLVGGTLAVIGVVALTEKEPGPPAMSRGQAMEFWFWCWAAVDAQERRFGPNAPVPAVRWKVSAFLRIQAAFERYHGDESSRRPGIRDSLEDRLARGLDPVGVVLFERYLDQQRRLWSERATGGSAQLRAEAEARLGVLRMATIVFHTLVRATAETIERSAAKLPVATDARARGTGVRLGGVLIRDDRTEGPIPPEEEEPRWKDAIRRLHAGREGLKS